MNFYQYFEGKHPPEHFSFAMFEKMCDTLDEV